jgi:hypothetical protein
MPITHSGNCAHSILAFLVTEETPKFPKSSKQSTRNVLNYCPKLSRIGQAMNYVLRQRTSS